VFPLRRLLVMAAYAQLIVIMDQTASGTQPNR